MPPTNTLARESKTLAFSIKATGITTSDDGQEFGQIECYGAIFDNIDDGNDRINKNAFTRTIQNSKARAKSRAKKYVLPILWQHDTNELIGGWYDLKEDDTGLLCKGEIALATQRGREYYALAKAGMSDQFSIIYDIPTGGAKYDKSGVRDLTEIRLFSIDVVTFAMNDETRLVGVKNMEIDIKSVHGDTSLPIGPRDASWDGSAAKKQIFSYAEDGDSFDVAKLKKCFLKQDGDPQTKGSWGYPFVNIVDGSPQINVAGVKACAGALSGARNADAGGDTAGMKKKVATMYGRINKKYPDAEPLTPPWEDDDGKANVQPKQQKTLMEHYNEEMAQDLLEDWQEVYVCALSCAVLDALTIGDTPATDIADALDDFKTLVLGKFVPQAQEVNLSQYMADNSYSPAASAMQNGSSSYGWMSSNRRRSQKSGRAISASNQTNIDGHVENLHNIANEAMKGMKAAMQQVHDAADGFAQTMAGNPPADDEQDDEDEQVEKAAASALRELKLIRTR